MFIFQLLLAFLIFSKGSTDFTSLEKYEESANYDITQWTRQLHLQQCVFVEIGDGFCALFVEVRPTPGNLPALQSIDVPEYFLGLCSCSTVRLWNLCTDELTKQRKPDCVFTEGTSYSNTSARVHRRLCDVTLLSQYAPPCNCSTSLAAQRLHKTTGFPTCFLTPLPDSLCAPRGVCGIAECTSVTIKGIHSARCSRNCHYRQPFCEDIDSWTSISPRIISIWSGWSVPQCNNTCGEGTVVATSTCHDQVTGKPAIDCIGPGSFCCQENLSKCYCEVSIFDGVMRTTRFTEACASTTGCIPSDSRTFTFEGELDSRNSINSNELYEDDDRERFEDAFESAESIRPSRRLLRAYHPYDGYKSRKSRMLRSEPLTGELRVGDSRRLDDGDDDQDYPDDDSQDDGGEDGDQESLSYRDEDKEGNSAEDDEEEDEETPEVEKESEEETIGLRGSAKGRRSPRKRTRVARSDYEASFEGKAEVDEPEKKGATTFESVGDECEDASTEAPQYYDYDASENGTSAQGGRTVRVTMLLMTVNILVAFLRC